MRASGLGGKGEDGWGAVRKGGRQHDRKDNNNIFWNVKYYFCIKKSTRLHALQIYY